MKVTVELDSRVWWQLAERAEKENKSVAKLIADLATGTVRPVRKPGGKQKWILELLAEGFSDQRVAELIGVTRAYVTQTRNRFGVASNHRSSKRVA